MPVWTSVRGFWYAAQDVYFDTRVFHPQQQLQNHQSCLHQPVGQNHKIIKPYNVMLRLTLATEEALKSNCH